MKKILNIITSAKGEASVSNKQSNAILERLAAAYPESKVHTHDLAKHPFPHLEESHIAAFYTPEEARTDENKAAIKHSDNAIKEILEADIIVIGVPVYNFGIPSTLKAWIDHIVRAGVTFKYENGVPVGYVTGKKVYLSIASGAVFSEGAYKSYDFVEPYLRVVFGFIGMTDITVFRVEGTSIPQTKDTAWTKALDTINNFAF